MQRSSYAMPKTGRPEASRSQVASRSRLEPAGVDPHLCGRSLRFRGAASDMWPENWSLNSKVRSPKNTGAFINRRWCCRKCSKGETIHHHVENNLLWSRDSSFRSVIPKPRSWEMLKIWSLNQWKWRLEGLYLACAAVWNVWWWALNGTPPSPLDIIFSIIANENAGFSRWYRDIWPYSQRSCPLSSYNPKFPNFLPTKKKAHNLFSSPVNSWDDDSAQWDYGNPL